MDMYKPKQMRLRDKVTDFGRKYIGDWAAKEVSLNDMLRYTRNTAIIALAVFYLAGCAGINYKIQGNTINGKENPKKEQTKEEKDEKSWWSKNVGWVVVGGAVITVILGILIDDACDTSDAFR